MYPKCIHVCVCLLCRDGSAVEIVGLCKSTVRWLVKLHNNGHFPYAAVKIHRGGIVNHTHSTTHMLRNGGGTTAHSTVDPNYSSSTCFVTIAVLYNSSLRWAEISFKSNVPFHLELLVMKLNHIIRNCRKLLQFARFLHCKCGHLTLQMNGFYSLYKHH